MKKIGKLILIILFTACLAVRAQHPGYIHLTEKDGLPDIEFYSIIEDGEGFIWLAADKGLFRYDGKEFKNYSHSDKRGLSVFGLKLDSKGRVWCNNISGQFFYVENNKLNLFVDLNEYMKGQLAKFSLFKNYLITSNDNDSNLYQINLDTKEIVTKSTGTRKNNFFYKKNDTLFYLNKMELEYTLDKVSGSKRIASNISKVRKEQKSSKLGHTFYKGRSLYYCYSVKNKAEEPSFFYEQEKELRRLKLPKELRETLIINFFEEDGLLWFCTYNGVFIYDFENGKFKYKTTYFLDKEVTKILKDKNNNYWFTTLRDGIYIVPNIFIKSYSLKKEGNNISVLKRIDSKAIMFGSTNGDIGILNKNSSEINYIYSKKKEKVFSICNNDDSVFVSLWSSSLVFNKKTKKINKSNLINNIKDFSVIDKDNILFASHRSASIFNVKSNKVSVLLNNKRAYTTYYDKKAKEIYVGYVDGLRKYNKAFKTSTIKFNNKPIFAIDIGKTNNGIIWVSTFKDGIIGIREGKAVVNYTEKNGLFSNETGVIKADGDLLWISTNKSLQVFNTKTKEFKSLTKKDGINSFHISDIVVFDDVLFFSSNKGIFQINKEKVFKSKSLSNFYFTKILIEDKEELIKNNYELDYTTKKVEFQFRTNGFLSEDDIVYKYRLLGASNKWSTITVGVNQVTFNTLSGGNYIFQLKSVNRNGKQETSVKSVKLNIKKPFYNQIWFYIASGVLLFFSVWYYFSKRVEKLKTKQKEVVERERMHKQMITSKLESLQSQMNPHFIFNALNSVQNLVLKGKKHEAYNYLTKFSLLMRENLNMSRKSFVYFDEELAHLKKYLELEKLRFKEGFEYKIEGNELIDDIKIPSMIIQPFVENAIKHGLLHKEEGIGKIELEFFQENGVLTCIIIDNGVGIDVSKRINKNNNTGISFSTKAIHDRLVLLRKYYKTDIGFSYEKIKEGTKVIMKIPYIKSNE